MHVIGEKLEEIICKSQHDFDTRNEGLFIEAKGFDRDNQLSVDAIDLRVDNWGYVMNNDKFECVNTLYGGKFDKHFRRVILNDTGYDIKPGDTLFIGTVERINLKGPYIGRVIGRSTYSRLGLSVNSSQDKFCGYNNAIIGLQIRNNTNQKIRIYPLQKLAQILIYKTEGVPIKKDSSYADEIEYTLPTIVDRERTQYNPYIANTIAKDVPNEKNIIKKLKDKKYVSEIVTIGSGVLVTSALFINSIFAFSPEVKIAIACAVVPVYIFMTIIAFILKMED